MLRRVQKRGETLELFQIIRLLADMENWTPRSVTYLASCFFCLLAVCQFVNCGKLSLSALDRTSHQYEVSDVLCLGGTGKRWMGAAVVPEGPFRDVGDGMPLHMAVLVLLSHRMCLLFDAPVPDITDQLPELATFKEQHPELAATVDTLPSVMMADRAPATLAKYSKCVSSLDGMGEDTPLAKLSGITSRSSLLPVGDISYSAVTGSNLVCPPWS